MEQPVQYCENCGKPLNANARFCGKCGKPVPPLETASPAQVEQPGRVPVPPPPAPAVKNTPPPPPAQARAPMPTQARAPMPAQAPAAPAEQVLGVIPAGIRRSGFLGSSSQTIALVITNARLIFAIQTAKMLQEQAKGAREAARQQGKGFFGQMGAALNNQGQHYLSLHPQAILAEQPGNSFVLHSQVRSVKFHTSFDSEDNQSETRLEIDTGAGKTTLFYSSIDEKRAKQLLAQVLGQIVR